MGVKDFILKQVLKRKLQGLPEDQQQMMIDLVGKHPEFFKKIGDEIEKRKKGGMSEMAASMQVMREHQGELQKLMQQK